MVIVFGLASLAGNRLQQMDLVAFDAQAAKEADPLRFFIKPCSKIELVRLLLTLANNNAESLPNIQDAHRDVPFKIKLWPNALLESSRLTFQMIP